ncbi:hypothetical protein F5884DRAFT_284436 [Xylogone sp. PMI_703]|nr:hypothetical protein F5884DRAFT_284436 [Xylogone sp. PMI_703]
MEGSSDQFYYSATESCTLTDNGAPPNITSTFEPSTTPTEDTKVADHIAVTPSMVSAYANMRGPVEDTPGEAADPLHDNLCNRDADPIELKQTPLMSPRVKYHFDEGWGNLDVVYWDPKSPMKAPGATVAPSEPTNLHPGQPGMDLHRGQNGPEEREIKFKYFEGSCSFKGKTVDYRNDEGPANYGYVPINGVWADPDSVDDVASALKGIPPIDFDDLPGTQSRGPRVLTLEELDKEYEFFNDYVSDDEGDPRDMRISVETYAAWAQGARKIVKDKNETEQEEIQKWVPPEKDEHSSNKKKPHEVKFTPQFDVDTGSTLSGHYELDSCPSPLMSAQGVDVMRKPANFTKSFPLVSQEIDNLAFLGSPPSVGSATSATPETLNSEGAHRSFHSQKFANAWAEIKDHLRGLQEKRKAAIEHFMGKYSEHQALQLRKSELDKENQFLKRCLSQKKHYIRYMKERVRKDTLAITRTLALGEAIDGDIERDVEAIQEKETEQETLLQHLGYCSIDEVPGLIPSRQSRSNSF